MNCAYSHADRKDAGHVTCLSLIPDIAYKTITQNDIDDSPDVSPYGFCFMFQPREGAKLGESLRERRGRNQASGGDK